MAVDPAMYCCFRWGAPPRHVLNALLLAVEDAIAPQRIKVGSTRTRHPYKRERFDEALLDQDLRLLLIEGESGSLRYSQSHDMGFWQAIVHLPDWPVTTDWVSSIAQQPGFTAALLGDAYDKMVQSETFPGHYQLWGLDTDGLRFTTDGFGEQSIDVSEHWGRGAIGPGMWFWAAARMWFGAPAFDVLDRTRLLTFGDGVVERTDGVIEVDLFDPLWPLEQIRERQRRFRQHMRYDDLEVSSPDAVVAPADPTIEIQTDHKDRPTRIIEWLDDLHHQTPRSKARLQRISLLDRSGSITEQVTQPAE